MDIDPNAPHDQNRDQTLEIHPQLQSTRLPKITTSDNTGDSGASESAGTSPFSSDPFASVKTSWDKDSLILSWLEDNDITPRNRQTLIEK